MYLYKNQKTDLLRFEIDEEKKTFLIHLNRSEILTECWWLTKEILTKIQVLKAIADVNNAWKFYEEYSTVSEEFLKIRSIVLANRAPYRVVGSHNLFEAQNEIRYATYEPTHEGIIQSFVDWFQMSKDYCESYIEEWLKFSKHIRV